MVHVLQVQGKVWIAREVTAVTSDNKAAYRYEREYAAQAGMVLWEQDNLAIITEDDSWASVSIDTCSSPATAPMWIGVDELSILPLQTLVSIKVHKHSPTAKIWFGKRWAWIVERVGRQEKEPEGSGSGGVRG